VASAHAEYQWRGSEQGRMILAGRSQDGVSPEVVIVEVASGKKARRFIAAGPFVASGLLGAILHPYRVAISRNPV